MIEKEHIKELAQQELTEEYFVVSVAVKKGNLIEVIIDGDNGVSIQKCVDVSRNIEKNLDREEEDFELSVSSFGLGKPLKVLRQYQKHIGRNVEVTPSEGKPVSGIIKNVGDDGFELETEVVERDGKKKIKTTRIVPFLFKEEPIVKSIISFK
jgi:ribosome maturation factor RimP